jgi:hypothetical protein
MQRHHVATISVTRKGPSQPSFPTAADEIKHLQLAEVWLAEVWLAEVWLVEVRLAEVCLAEVRLAEVRLAEPGSVNVGCSWRIL